MDITVELTAGDFSHAGHASSKVKQILKQLNIPAPIIRRVVVALFEAEVNVVAHSLGGSLSCSISPDGIHMVVADRGPGIPDLDLAMSEGFSTASPEVREMGYGAGMGLPNIKKHVDTLDISTGSGEPTVLTMSISFLEDAQ